MYFLWPPSSFLVLSVLLLVESGDSRIWKLVSSCSLSLLTAKTTPGKGGAYLCDIHFGLEKILASQEDQKMAARLATTMSNSLKGRPVQGRVFQGKEPPQFVAIFQPMVVLKVSKSWTAVPIDGHSDWFKQQAELVERVVSTMPVHLQVSYKESIKND